jgi:hypothetical protein
VSSQTQQRHVPGLASALRTTDQALAQEAFHRPRWLREEHELNAFEEIGMSTASVLDLTDRREKAEVELDRMAGAEQPTVYDLEGRA